MCLLVTKYGFICEYIIAMVILYTFMSACLHVKINADIEKLPLQTYADVVTPHKIRVFYKMSACL